MAEEDAQLVWVVEASWPVQLTNKDAHRAIQQALVAGAVKAEAFPAIIHPGGRLEIWR